MKPLDIQVNGYAGTDFCAQEVTADQLHHACQMLRDDGVDSILATLITDHVDRLVAKLRNLCQLREQDSLVRDMIAGFHIEGPFLNPRDGFIGAHPPDAVVPANLDDMKRLLDSSSGLTRLVTLAPECDPDFATTRYLADLGITVSAGHCDPELEQLRAAVDNGLSMVTHLGNGCPVTLARHDNFLQRVFSLREYLWICFIPDGAHVPFFVLRNYLDLIGSERTIMVTDAISAARLGPGLHEISGMAVEVDEDGVARKPGSPNLAGSTVTMPKLLGFLREPLGCSDAEVLRMVDENPRRALGLGATV